MFRYIAFNWAPQAECQASRASELEATLSESSCWYRAFASNQLQVWVAGCSPGANQIYEMPSGRGVVLGRLFRRHEAPGVTTRDLVISIHEDAQVIESDGRTLVERFWGRWIAFLPSRTGEGRVLRDPSGALPCYRMESDGLTIVFSWLQDVLDLIRRPPPPPNWDAIAATLVYRRLGARETALEGVTQILAGELAGMAAAGPTPRALWSAAEAARAPIELGLPEAARLLRETTTDCVRAWMSCYDDLVLRLSGGVDSAILLGCLFVEPPTANVCCLNYFSPGAESDERVYARLAASKAGCKLVERNRDSAFHLSELPAPGRTPVPGSYLGRMGSDRMDAEITRAEGAPVLFTGAGGDQLFQEVRSTWPAADYLQLHGPDLGFPRAVLDSARLGRVSFWRALRLAVRDRLARHDPLEGIGQYITLMPRDVVAGVLHQPGRFVHPGLLAASDLPIGKLFHLSALICPFDYYNPYGPETSPELVHPLMSQPLQELCLKLPTYVLTHGGRGRALARQAFADRLPPEIATRRSKGCTTDHVADVLQRSLNLARDLLLEGQLVRRGLLDRQRVEVALSGRPCADQTDVPETHSCIGVEAWLRQISA